MTAAETMLEKYLEAEQKLLAGKSIQWQGRTLTFENLDIIQRGRREWSRIVEREKNRGPGFSVAEFVR